MQGEKLATLVATLVKSLQKTEMIEMKARKATNTRKRFSYMFRNIPAFYRTYEVILP